VTWTVSPANQGSTVDQTTTTDSTGQTQTFFLSALPGGGASYLQSTVTAKYSSASAVFYETSVTTPSSGVLDVTPTIVTPTLAQIPVSGPAGGQGAVPVKVLVMATGGNQAGHGVPNIAVSVSPDIANNPSTIACAGGVILSDSNGNALCNLVYGGKVGSGSFTVSIGGYGYDFTYKVLAGPPGTLLILSGNNQSGNPGAALPSPLTAQLTDLGGNQLAGVQLVWESVVAGTVTLSNVQSTTDANGRTSASATLGTTAGNVQVRVRTSDGKVFALFNLTVNVIEAGMVKVSGDQQTPAVTGTAFGEPLVVQVNDKNNNPVQGAPVTFAVTSGSATLGTKSASTNAQGQASTTVTAGSTIGPVVITATSATFSVTFNLTVRSPGPVCPAHGQTATFWNGASFMANMISPGSVATIVCQGLAPGINGSVVPGLIGPLPTQLASVTVTFGDGPSGSTINAPIYNVSNVNGQESVTVQVPFEITPGPQVPVTITVGGGSAQISASVQDGAPGIFETVMSDGVTRAVALRPDGTYVSPTNPALRGEKIRCFVTGLIPPAGAVATDQTAPPDSDIVITTPVIVGVDNGGVLVDQVTYAHNLIGVWIIEFEVPANAAPGVNAPFAVAIPVNGHLVFGQGSKLPIQ